MPALCPWAGLFFTPPAYTVGRLLGRFVGADGMGMLKSNMRSLVWMAPALLLAAGCGTSDPEQVDACENVTCGVNAQCVDGACACDSGFSGDADVACQPDDDCAGVVCGFNATCSAGECRCNAGFEGDASKVCTPVVECTESSCSGHGACEVESGAIVCDCDEGYAGKACAECATGYTREGDQCVPNDLCASLECTENGSCVVEGGVAGCDCAEGWAGELCDGCAEGYALIGTECVKKTKTVACTDVAPENAGSTVADVEITYDEDTGEWSEPAACEWACDEGYVDFDGLGSCIDTRTVDCAPSDEIDNAEITNPLVEINFVDGNWSEPAACEWACNDDYDDYYNEGACLNETMVPCVHGIVGYPANSSVSNPQVPIVFDGTKWSSPVQCEWACDEGFDEFDGECIDTRTVSCTPAADPVPANASVTNAFVDITFDGEKWSSPATCEWDCDTGYDNYNDEGQCLNETTVDCAPAADPVPDNAEVTNPLVSIAFVDGAWSAPAECQWACEVGFFESDGACVVVPTIADCELLTPSVDGLSTLSHAIKGSVTLGVGDSAHVTGQACYFEGALATCETAVYDAGHDEFVAQVTFPVGEFDYLYRFSVDSGATWTDCGLNGDPAEYGKATLVYPTPTEQVEAVRAAASQTTAGNPVIPVTIRVDNVFVTGIMPGQHDGKTYFLVQATETGPALGVEIPPTTTVAVGDEISFTALSVRRLGLMATVASLTDFELISIENDLSGFFEDVDGFDEMDALESRLVRFTGRPVSSFIDTNDSYWTAEFVVGGEPVDVRVESTHLAEILDEAPSFFDTLALAIENDCDMDVRALLWRAGATPLPLILDGGPGRLKVVDEACAAFFGVVGAESKSNTEVRVTFTTKIDEASIVDPAEQFVFEPAVWVTGYEPSADGLSVVFTTGSQVKQPYSVTVSGVNDVDGRALRSGWNTATFEGTPSPVVISQVYAGGGNSGATFTHDFVELFNRSATSVSLDGWSLQQQVASGSQVWRKTTLAGDIASGGYFLISLASGTNGAPLPTPYFEGDTTMNLATASGRVALVRDDMLLEKDDCDPWGASIVDFYGYGSGTGANDNICFRGSRGTHMTNNANSVVRIDVCGVADDNGTDFERVTPVVPRTADSANERAYCAEIYEP